MIINYIMFTTKKYENNERSMPVCILRDKLMFKPHIFEKA
jgi:hypothetical protein